MIGVTPVPEPAAYRTIAKRGSPWLKFTDDLAEGFAWRCGYAATIELQGEVEHYLSKKLHPDKIFDWSNFRYVSGWVNQQKRTKDEKILDPYQVGDGWFEIQLPSLELVLTDRIPMAERNRAAFTIRSLKLDYGARILRERRHHFRAFLSGAMSLDLVRERMPLLADAIQKAGMQPGIAP